MATATSIVVPLQTLRSGENAYVETLCGEHGLVQRLRELGFADGTPVQMLQPGSPCIVKVSGQRLCFRPDERTSILVRTEVAG